MWSAIVALSELLNQRLTLHTAELFGLVCNQALDLVSCKVNYFVHCEDNLVNIKLFDDLIRNTLELLWKLRLRLVLLRLNFNHAKLHRCNILETLHFVVYYALDAESATGRDLLSQVGHWVWQHVWRVFRQIKEVRICGLHPSESLRLLVSRSKFQMTLPALLDRQWLARARNLAQPNWLVV